MGVKRILVTGGAGYIGSVLVRQLLSRGFTVRVLDCLLFGDFGVRDLRDSPRFALINGDVRNPRDRDAALEGVDAVVHLAAIVGDPACAQQPELAEDTNLHGSLALFEAARHSPTVKRFVFVSTCSNYGRMEGIEYLTEDSPLKPLSLYAEAKVEVERHLLGASGREDLAPTVLRFATAYGLSPRMRFDLTVNEFTREVVLDRELQIYGEQFWRPYAHTEDLARACIAVLEADRSVVDGEVFNVGDTEENYTKKQLAELLLQRRPKAKIEYVHKEEDPRDYKVSFSKIREALSFKITRRLPDGIAEIAEALEAGAFSDPFSAAHRNS